MISPLYLVLIFLTHWFHSGDLNTRESRSYHAPLDIPLVLSANFGELRSNHFHMGLDLKTEAREGLSLYSIDDGYVSRINVSPYGYGLAVYINHPNGITSVYAHCQRLLGKFKTRVRDIQALTKNSETDVYFEPNDLPVKKGEVFALSGNSGSSRGAHLHFEIRDTKSEMALNPLLFGFKISDSKPPTPLNIKIFALDEFGYMRKGKAIEYSIKNGTVGNGAINIPSNFCSKKGGIGFAINAIDKFDDSYHNCGIYGARILVNGDTLMHQYLDQMSFDATRYINGYTDLPSFKSGKKYHKTFRTVENRLPVYKKNNLGILLIKPNENYLLQCEVFDFTGNKSKINFEINVMDGPIIEERSLALNPNYINPSESYFFELEDASLSIPRGCTYEPMIKNISQNGTSLYFKSDYYPVQEAFTIKMKARNDFQIQKQYIAVKNGNLWSGLETTHLDGWLYAKSKLFGEISIQIDEKGPNIVLKNSKGIVYKSKTKRLVWGLGDYQTGLSNYSLQINGQWYPLTYETKGDYAYFEIDELNPGIYNLNITATDFAGNKSEENYTVEIKI